MRKKLVKIFLIIFIFTIVFLLIIKTNLYSDQNPSIIQYSKTIDKSIDNKKIYIQRTIRNMTLEEKIGQLFIWNPDSFHLTDNFKKIIEETQPGGIIIMNNNISDDLKDFITDMQNVSKIPLFITIDQEGGNVKRLKEDTNPGPRILSMKSNKEFCDTYQNTSELLASFGINVNFGIPADIAWNKSSYVYNRSYGNNATEVKNLVQSAIACSQETFNTIKHYPGHGRTSTDSHLSIPKIDITKNEWLKTDAIPFQTGIDNNIEFIMTSHTKWKEIDDDIVTFSSIHVENLREMGYKGIILTDSLNMLDNQNFDSKESVEKAIKAGHDMILYISPKEEPIQIIEYILEKIKNDEIQEDTIDNRLKRILNLKYEIEHPS